MWVLSGLSTSPSMSSIIAKSDCQISHASCWSVAGRSDYISDMSIPFERLGACFNLCSALFYNKAAKEHLFTFIRQAEPMVSSLNSHKPERGEKNESEG